jgi:hypothetical protein
MLGIQKRLRKPRSKGLGQPDQFTQIVGFRELYLVPYQKGLEGLFGGLLGVEGCGLV